MEEDVVGHVPRVVTEGARRGVGEDDGRLSDLECVPHRPRRHVGQVDHHPQTVHLHHHLLQETIEREIGVSTSSVGEREGKREINHPS